MATGYEWDEEEDEELLPGTAFPLTIDLFVELVESMEVLLYEGGFTKRICFFKSLEASTHLCIKHKRIIYSDMYFKISQV